MYIAIIGCGYVAEFYAKTMVNYPELQLTGAYDPRNENLVAFCRLWNTHQYESLDEVLADRKVEIVLNLTNPRSHFEVTKKCLAAGKHVYSEKPLAMRSTEAKQLVELAHRQGVYLASAPCSVLSETAQTLGKAIRDGVIGPVRLVYANFEDGILNPGVDPGSWKNEAGIAWPVKDEYEVGCTYEHAGYVLTWLGAYFGPAKSVSAYSATIIKDKGIAVDVMAPDFSSGCIEYANGTVARVTCGLVAPHDKSLTVIGEKGILYVQNIRNDAGRVYLRRFPSIGWQLFIEKLIARINVWMPLPFTGREWIFQSRLPLVTIPRSCFVSKRKPVDFCRGPAELASAIREKRACRLSAEFGLHIVEVTEALQYPERFSGKRENLSEFAPASPIIF